MASEDYTKALKLAKTAYRKAVAAGEYPYLPALDDMIDTQQVRTEEPLGLISIQQGGNSHLPTISCLSCLRAVSLP